MLPESIPNYAIGPFIGLAANGIMALLCAIALAFYRTYRLLRSLFLFYLILTFCFLGWVIFGLQKTPQSSLLGYRIEYAALALLPACCFWFFMSLFNEKNGWFLWAVTGASLALSCLALFGQGPYFFALPLKPDPVALGILKPQSKLLRVVIQSFCLGLCLCYFFMILRKILHLKGKRPVHLICAASGMLVWFVGGVHDAVRSAGVVLFVNEFVLWFASLWLSIFLTMAIILHFRSLERAVRDELQRLNQVKSKALDHLAHELRTPLAVVKGKIQLLKRRIQTHTPPVVQQGFFDTLERHIHRLLSIQQEAEAILRSHPELEEELPHRRFSGLSFPKKSDSPKSINPLPFAQRALEEAKRKTRHRQIQFSLEGKKDVCVFTEPKVLEEVLAGLMKNAIENTPDEGAIRISLEPVSNRVLLKIQDSGIGIIRENQAHIFDGLFHAGETDWYGSKRPYDFNAGGKGLDLFRMKLNGERLGFQISVESRRCRHLPADDGRCPGRISLCSPCRQAEDCLAAGGSTFSASFPAMSEAHE